MELFLLNTFAHLASFLFPLTFAGRLPQSTHDCRFAVTWLSPGLRYYSTVRRLATHCSPLRFPLIGLLTTAPPVDPASPPGVTYWSSLPCRPHTPWCDGWMSSAFASIVQARPCPIFGRPVRLWGGPLWLRPGSSPHALRIPSHDGHPALQSTTSVGSRSALAVSSFRLRARL